MFSKATYGTSSGPVSTTYGATTYGASTSYGTSTTYGASSKTVLPTSYGTAGSVRNPISTTVAAATTNTVAPTTKTTTVVKGFAAGMRISYKARKDGKSYPGSVVSQSPSGGLKIKLDGGDVKDIAAADMFRVTLDSTTTNSGTTQKTVTSNRASSAPRTTQTTVTSNRASSAPPSPTKEAKVLKRFSVGKKTIEGKTIKPAGKTSVPTGKTSFAPGQRINYMARKDGKTYPGSVVSQTAGGLKIKLDGGDVKDIAAADLFRVSLAPIGGSLSAPISATTYVAPKQSVTKAVTPRSVAMPAMATTVASKPAMATAVYPKPAALAVSGGKKMAKTLGGGISAEEMSAIGYFAQGMQEYVPGDLIMM
jgi:hypothetical protein|mmetsp:Transcript_18521/g.29221  ORF Transcript_18521/g.29221 Transcript_18521/m.29221 type:complete len:365 (-) Transcript_18521:157-1251(-)